MVVGRAARGLATWRIRRWLYDGCVCVWGGGGGEKSCAATTPLYCVKLI